ncbi:tRNA (adenosine(37)-N6)-threonylcarbamoyltransferase complex dimerization subunit type 1 TsaB [Thermus thermamylovorans]|uniref:tRNA (Adenosine(37)-N6)-threonylcarbamoyltransferase complex dimerization subunit type 1 TsaB n=1 Tax=Thermus thermamylovorans TaxID=2509362 RepID=A0A4Q9B4G8_9DEIN|nr:tRNA (adenosine(37)-N6)-threonylcarbamoyltransferase complex dimerization subunit type 1 TsaB [Thermus thermamylovorans]TBH20692.1 tRNA (adenosine(37)-N6)-threonylcarbamoyltransferase complex dimerization subunit type 1 TsaB [Thermus thermamylovorans]
MPAVWTLTLDTATPYLALGLFRGEEGVGRVVRVERRHEEALFPLLDDLLAEVGARKEEIGALVLGEGPGSYTGLRIALAAGLGVALAQGARVYGVNSLLAACWPYLEESGPPLTPLFTARNRLYYGATYTRQGGRPLELLPPGKLRAEELPPTGLLLDPPPDPRALYELLPFAREGVEPLYL